MSKKSKQSSTVRLGIEEFFDIYDVKKTEVADYLGVHKQQIQNWSVSPNTYMFEYNEDTGDLSVIKTETPIKKCIMQLDKK